MNIIVSGTGRCGTGYMAKWLTSAGIKCSHEGVFNRNGWDGAWEKIQLRRKFPQWGWVADSSWLAAPWLGRPELADVKVVHVVRNPKATIDSFLRLIKYQPEVGPYFEWAAQFLPKIQQMNFVDRMVYWYITFNKMVESHAHFRYRIEDDDAQLREFFGIGTMELYDNKRYNSRTGLGPSDVKLDDISPGLRERLLIMTERYGYEWNDVSRAIEATWWKGQTVLLDSRSGAFGGSWQWRDTEGRVLAYDTNLVKFFYEQVCQVENPVLVDVGASTGSFTLLATLHPMKVIAFEPSPDVFDVLQSNVKLHDLDTELHQVALSDTDGDGVLKVPIGSIHAALSTLGKPRGRGLPWIDVAVQTRTLDSYALPKVDFLKIDTEGAELLILKGAEQTIKRCMPSILLEYQSLNTQQFGYSSDCSIELLKEWGYTKFVSVGIEDMWITP